MKKEIPTLEIDGKTYTAQKPTMKIWREVVAFDEKDKEEWSLADVLEGELGVLQVIFGISEADAEKIDLADIIPTYRKAAGWVIAYAASKIQVIPNGEAGDAESR